jgi:hypothetical protein
VYVGLTGESSWHKGWDVNQGCGGLTVHMYVLWLHTQSAGKATQASPDGWPAVMHDEIWRQRHSAQPWHLPRMHEHTCPHSQHAMCLPCACQHAVHESQAWGKEGLATALAPFTSFIRSPDVPTAHHMHARHDGM